VGSVAAALGGGIQTAANEYFKLKKVNIRLKNFKLLR
jgi:hypothetical protein